jgi:hypothetical protein
MPLRAARPMPATMETGVEMTSAPGATDDQQRQRQADVLRHREGGDREPDDRRRIPLRKALDHALARGLFLLRFLDALNNAGKGGVGADIGGADAQQPVLGDRSCMDVAARRFLGRHRLTGNRRLADGGGAFGYFTIHRDALTGPDQHGLAKLDHMSRHLDRLAFAQHGRGGGRGIKQCLQRATGLPHGARLQPAAEHEQEGDGRRLPDFANNERADRRDGDEQFDAEMLYTQRAPGTDRDVGAGKKCGRDHQRGPCLDHAEAVARQKTGRDQPAAADRQPETPPCRMHEGALDPADKIAHLLAPFIFIHVGKACLPRRHAARRKRRSADQKAAGRAS